MSDRILRLKDVLLKTGLSKSTIYVAIKKGIFPEPIKLFERSVGWPESFVDDWIESRILHSNEDKKA